MSDSVSKWHLMQEEKQPVSLERDIINNFEEDLIVQKVISKFNERSNIGVKKYNTTLQENNEGMLAFLTHLQEGEIQSDISCWSYLAWVG